MAQQELKQLQPAKRQGLKKLKASPGKGHQADVVPDVDLLERGTCPNCNLAHPVRDRPCPRCAGTKVVCVPFVGDFWCKSCDKYFP